MESMIDMEDIVKIEIFDFNPVVHIQYFFLIFFGKIIFLEALYY